MTFIKNNKEVAICFCLPSQRHNVLKRLTEAGISYTPIYESRGGGTCHEGQLYEVSDETKTQQTCNKIDRECQEWSKRALARPRNSHFHEKYPI